MTTCATSLKELEQISNIAQTGQTGISYCTFQEKLPNNERPESRQEPNSIKHTFPSIPVEYEGAHPASYQRSERGK